MNTFRTFLAPAVLALSLAACSGNTASTSDQTPPPAVSSTSTSVGTVPSSTHTVNMTVENWAFTPNAVTFKKGEHAVIHLTDTTGIHGFGVRDLGINVRLQPGDTQDIVIPTDQAGTFSFRCTVPCGPGHQDMTGTIVIE